MDPLYTYTVYAPHVKITLLFHAALKPQLEAIHWQAESGAARTHEVWGASCTVQHARYQAIYLPTNTSTHQLGNSYFCRAPRHSQSPCRAGLQHS